MSQTRRTWTVAASTGYERRQLARALLVVYVFVLTFRCVRLQAQVAPAASMPGSTEQQFEDMTTANEDAEMEDDSFFQSMQQFLKHPLNLNAAERGDLEELGLLSPLQVESLLSYRKLFGDLLSVYELQAIPNFDLPVIRKIRPYVTVTIATSIVRSVGTRMRDGTRTLLLRGGQVLEKQKGFKLDSTVANNYYPGGREKIFVRYKYQFRNLLQYGLLGEKDPGEQFFRGAQKTGFDFYSAHLFLRNVGRIRSLALGDFTVNFGQGLTQWQSLGFRKSGEMTNLKRQSPVLKPYNSPGESNFHRGIGVTVALKQLEATAFASYRKIDANFSPGTGGNPDVVTALQASGLHRTSSEIADKGVERQLTVGANLSLQAAKFHMGLNAVQYQFSLPIEKRDEPYNLFALRGKTFGNYSWDYSYTFRNVHLFGELATSSRRAIAFLSGALISVDPKLDVSLLYRNIAPAYQSLYTNAYTENTQPTNERGVFAAITIRPASAWRVDAYADFYRFPWLRYLVNAPSTGSDYLLQASYKPGKQLEIYVRLRSETKAKNDNTVLAVLSPVLPKQHLGLRGQVNFRLNPALSFRHRVEMTWYDAQHEDAEHGFAGYVDLLLKPPMRRYSGGIRLQYFDTDGYNSRVYAYENDVLFSFSIPVLYGKGYRYYLNLNYDLSKKLSTWLRWAQTIYRGQETIGTGLDAISGNKKAELKLQVLYEF